MTSALPSIEAPFTLGAQIEARARHPEYADRVLLRQGDRSWTYRQYRDECVRMAHFLRGRLGAIDPQRPGHVAILLENHLELLSLYGACGYAGLTLFGINTGLRGETLAGVLEQSGARLLVVDERLRVLFASPSLCATASASSPGMAEPLHRNVRTGLSGGASCWAM